MTRILVCSRDLAADRIIGWALDPLKRATWQLRWKLGVTLAFKSVKTLEELHNTILEDGCDVAMVFSAWDADASKLHEMFAQLRARPKCPRLIYFDALDQSCSPFLGIAEHVDLYVKKQLLKDRTRYLQPSPTGYLFSDFMAEHCGLDMGSWHFGSTIAEEHLHKLYLGWNVATKDSLVRELSLSRVKQLIPRPQTSIDLHYRVGLDDPEDPGRYYNAHREILCDALHGLDDQFTVVAAAGASARVPYKTFLRELRSSRMAVSPFGWGEVTDRDYLVVLNRTLLVKPDMSHIETEPNIYIPGVTYAPLRWDLSDLRDVCQYYKEHADEAEAMATAALERYRSWFKEKRLVKSVKGMLETIGV